MKVERELISASIEANRLVRIRHAQIDTGQDMGGQLWLEAQHARWVTDNLRICMETYAFAPVDLRDGEDHLRIFESGHELAPVINLRNRRANEAAHGGVYALMMSRGIAVQLARALHALG
ncbi:MAG TPA: hypothetical protein VF275_01420 [Gammaproteobacteria bacterium]